MIRNTLSLAATSGAGEAADWRRGLGALLIDRAALAAAVADRKLLPEVPPGMPIG